MILLAQGKKQAEIAKALGRSSSTISRELKRHALESYSATNAQNSYLKHRQNSKAQRKLEQPEYFNLVQEKFLTENWSPEQISARLKLEKSEFCHVFHDDFLYAVFCLCGAVCDWLCVRLYQTTLNKYHDKWLNN